MTPKHVAMIVVVLGVAGGAGYYLLQRPSPSPSPEPPAVSSTELETDTTALEAAIKKRVETKAKLQAFRAQLSIYEKVLQHAPGNAEAQRRVDTLRREIETLENQNAPR